MFLRLEESASLLASAMLSLCRHRDGAVCDARGELGERISRTGGNDEHIQNDRGTDGLGFHNGVQNPIAADLLHGANGILSLAKARVGRVNAFVHDG